MTIVRNVRIAGRRTSLRLEAEYWTALEEIGRFESFSMHDLCTFIRLRYPQGSLASATRRFVTGYFRDLAAARGADTKAAPIARPKSKAS